MHGAFYNLGTCRMRGRHLLTSVGRQAGASMNRNHGQESISKANTIIAPELWNRRKPLQGEIDLE